jgi:hypothetical protein
MSLSFREDVPMLRRNQVCFERQQRGLRSSWTVLRKNAKIGHSKRPFPLRVQYADSIER